MKTEVKKRRLLLIEDDRLDQMAFERAMREQPGVFEYRIAASIAEARKILSSEKFDVIITDYQLPDGVGMEILAMKPESPIIMTTGTGDEETAVNAMKLGACDYLIKDPDRNYLKILPTTVDLALRRWQNERQVALLSFAVRSVTDSIFITDQEGRMIFVNQAFCKTYGYTADEILGQSTSRLWKKTNGDPSGYEGECTHQRKDGSEFPVFFSSASLNDDSGKQIATVSIARDITDFKKSERVLLQKTEELARSRAELEQMQLFAFAATHDLQEPLHKIITFVDLLKTESAASLDPNGKEMLGRIEVGARRIRVMMEQLRELALISTAERPFQRIKLASVMKEVLTDLETRISETDARVEVGPLPELMGDEFQLRRLFLNLLSNALKFRKPDQAPKVSIHSRGLQTGGRSDVEITVKDEGIGFDEKFLNRLFKPFQRLNSQDIYPGSGIGLAICNRIVLHHGGTLAAHGTSGQGASFILTFPAAP